MSTKRTGARVPVGLGFRAERGGAVVVGVALERNEPRVVLSSYLATAADGDRLSREPYHVAAEMQRGPDGGASAEAVTAVAEGRKRQDALAVKGLNVIVHQLRGAGYEPAVAALLVNRAGWMTDLLAYSLAFPDHPPVAEGLAVREALRHAFGQCGVDVAEMDEKSLPEIGAEVLRLSPTALDAHLKTLGTIVGPPWRREQKLACLAAWIARISSIKA